MIEYFSLLLFLREAKRIKQPLQIYEVSALGGEYACSLEEIEEIVYPVMEEIILELYPIKDKMLSTIPVVTRLKLVNVRSAVVEVTDEMRRELTFFRSIRQGC